MNIKLPDDLLSKTDKEIREMILSYGLDNFSKILVSFLENEVSFNELPDNPELLCKVAITIDAVLRLYQIRRFSGSIQKESIISQNLVNKFVDIYQKNISVNNNHACDR